MLAMRGMDVDTGAGKVTMRVKTMRGTGAMQESLFTVTRLEDFVPADQLSW